MAISIYIECVRIQHRHHKRIQYAAYVRYLIPHSKIRCNRFLTDRLSDVNFGFRVNKRTEKEKNVIL
jgi:hypothetical protein